jgi:hypothetical protein
MRSTGRSKILNFLMQSFRLIGGQPPNPRDFLGITPVFNDFTGHDFTGRERSVKLHPRGETDERSAEMQLSKG